MDGTKLHTIAQLQEFLDATPEVGFTAAGDGDTQRYEHISRVLKRFDYPQRGKCERGVVLAYLRRTSGYSRPQITRMVARWDENRLAAVPLSKRYRAPAAPFVRKYTRAISNYSCRWNAPMRTSVVRPSRICCSAPTACMTIPATSAWSPCQCHTCTTCAKAPTTKPSAPASTRRVPYATPMACGLGSH